MRQGVIEACWLIAWALGVLGLNGETSQTLISLVGVGGVEGRFETNEIGRDFLPPSFADGRWQSGASPSRLWRTGAAPRRDKGGDKGPEKRRLYRRLIASSSGIRGPAAPAAAAAAASRGLSKDTAAAERAAMPERLTANLYPPRTN